MYLSCTFDVSSCTTAVNVLNIFLLFSYNKVLKVPS